MKKLIRNLFVCTVLFVTTQVAEVHAQAKPIIFKKSINSSIELPAGETKSVCLEAEDANCTPLKIMVDSGATGCHLGYSDKTFSDKRKKYGTYVYCRKVSGFKEKSNGIYFLLDTVPTGVKEITLRSWGDSVQFDGNYALTWQAPDFLSDKDGFWTVSNPMIGHYAFGMEGKEKFFYMQGNGKDAVKRYVTVIEGTNRPCYVGYSKSKGAYAYCKNGNAYYALQSIPGDKDEISLSPLDWTTQVNGWYVAQTCPGGDVNYIYKDSSNVNINSTGTKICFYTDDFVPRTLTLKTRNNCHVSYGKEQKKVYAYCDGKKYFDLTTIPRDRKIIELDKTEWTQLNKRGPNEYFMYKEK